MAASGGPSIDGSNVDSTICFTGVLSTEFVSKFGSLSSSGCCSLDVNHDFGGSSVCPFLQLVDVTDDWSTSLRFLDEIIHWW